MEQKPRTISPNLIALLVAIAVVINLVLLSLLGILQSLPQWLAVIVVVLELLSPFVVHRVLTHLQKRNGG